MSQSQPSPLAERHDHTALAKNFQGLPDDHPARVAERTKLALEVYWTCKGYENATGAQGWGTRLVPPFLRATPAALPNVKDLSNRAFWSYGYDAAALMTAIIMGWTLPSIRNYEVYGSQKLVRVLKRFYHKNHPLWGYMPGAWPRKK